MDTQMVEVSKGWRFALVFCLLFAACSSAPGPAYNDSWESVRGAVVASLPLGVSATSVNGRTFTSGYFDPKNVLRDGKTLKERAQATVTILGAGRPYHLKVSVTVYKRAADGDYDDDGSDEKLEDNLLMRIQKDLAHRREGRDVIDEFRVF